MIDWLSTGYFRCNEFDSPDAPGSGDMMDPDFIRLLVQLRQDCGFPFHINSGYRTPSHNSDPIVGGKPDSAHLRGMAADIVTATSQQRFALVRAALLRGVKRVGIGKTFVHLDVDSSLPQEVVWLY